MTLIMNNLGFSISLLAMVISLSMAYLKFKVEMADRKDRLAIMARRSEEMTKTYFNYHKYDNK